MKALSDDLYELAHEIQALSTLQDGLLGGGTNLALRFAHRESDDIDIFFPYILGHKGYEQILQQVRDKYKDKLVNADYPSNYDDQFMFQRLFIKQKHSTIKVEILQNSPLLNQPDIVQDLRLIAVRDIGLMKLVTAASRANRKDIYDLDYITDQIPLSSLMNDLLEKEKKFSDPRHRTIFQLDNDPSPTEDPNLLLKFESPEVNDPFRPGHSNPEIKHLPESKNWLAARSSWRRKVRGYFREIGKPFPDITPIEYTKKIDNDDGFPKLNLGSPDEDGNHRGPKR